MYFDSMTLGFLAATAVIAGFFAYKWSDLVPCDRLRLFKHTSRYPHGLDEK